MRRCQNPSSDVMKAKLGPLEVEGTVEEIVGLYKHMGSNKEGCAKPGYTKPGYKNTEKYRIYMRKYMRTYRKGEKKEKIKDRKAWYAEKFGMRSSDWVAKRMVENPPEYAWRDMAAELRKMGADDAVLASMSSMWSQQKKLVVVRKEAPEPHTSLNIPSV
jgi:hypothetical protein